jgi:hypothetical protein
MVNNAGEMDESQDNVKLQALEIMFLFCLFYHSSQTFVSNGRVTDELESICKEVVKILSRYNSGIFWRG